MSFHQDRLLEALSSPIAAGVVEVLPSDDEIVNGLERAFSFSGSKIDWAAVRGHLSATQVGPGHDEFHRFFDARRNDVGGNQTAFYVNDGLTDGCVSASLFTFQRHLDSILPLPGHHYFVAEDFSWCMAYTMEGDIDFGWAS